MACAPTPCPPVSAPTPVTRPTWTIPAPANCGLGGIFYNTPQTYVDTCPAGSPTPPISVTIPAYAYSSSVSQEDADDIALAVAEELALALRAENPCEAVDGFLVTEDEDFLITEDEDFLIP